MGFGQKQVTICIDAKPMAATGKIIIIRRMIGSAAEVTYYLTEGQSGRKGISENYRYSSLSEDAGLSDDVPYPGADITADNRLGIQYRDHVATMTGMQTAYEGKYAAMLVPYSVIASTDEQAEVTDEEPGQGGSASYRGICLR